MTPGQLERRAKVTAAVIELISTTRPDSLQMRDVADTSGVSLGTIYRYFAGKDHLLAAALTDWHAQLARRLGDDGTTRRRPAFVAGSTPRARVVSFVRVQMRAFQRHPNLARLRTWVYASADPCASEEIERVTDENRRALAELMRGSAGEVVEPASRAISSTMTLSIMHWQAGRMTFGDALRSVEDVASLVVPD